MGERVESGLMVIEIMGNDVHYTFKPTGKAYEIRRVSARDLSMLRLAGRDPAFKASKTVQVLTHLYKDSHYFADTGEPALRPAASYGRSSRTRRTSARTHEGHCARSMIDRSRAWGAVASFGGLPDRDRRDAGGGAVLRAGQRRRRRRVARVVARPRAGDRGRERQDERDSDRGRMASMRVLALLAAVFAVSCEEGRRDRPTVSPEIAEKYAREAYNAEHADLPAGNSADTPQGYFARVGRDFNRQGMNVALDAKGDTLTLVTSGSDDLGMEQCSLLKNSFRPGRSHDVVDGATVICRDQSYKLHWRFTRARPAR